MRSPLLSLALVSLAASAACAQKNDPDKVVPNGGVSAPGWMGRIDPQAVKQGKSINDDKFITMGPGFHVTAGPAAIYWNAANSVAGNYTVSATFRQTKPTAHREGYGLILFGSNLDQPNQSYAYFLVSQDGNFLINHRANDSTVHKIIDWTVNAAVNKPAENGSVTNKLTVNATATDVIFLVNDKEVQRLPRATLDADGVKSGAKEIAGLRINHNLDVHVGDFSVTEAK